MDHLKAKNAVNHWQSNLTREEAKHNVQEQNQKVCEGEFAVCLQRSGELTGYSMTLP